MQGFNMGRYVPPEFEGQTTGNKLYGKKAPGFRGDKQTVRFEMPFNIFCTTCDGHIAQGVRFNAEKKKVGNYFSTPIFSFRMRHVVCSGWIEIRTDPQNTAYVVTEGGKKKAADDELQPGIIKIRDPIEAVAEDPFARTEKNVQDKTEAKQGAARILELKGLSDRQWADPYEHSRKMRKVFRAERKAQMEKDATTEAILDRAGLSIELLDELPEDAQRAKLIEFGGLDDEQRMFEAHSKPLFEQEPHNRPTPSTKGKLKTQQATEKTKEALQKNLVRNTRAAMDPFLQHDRPRPGPGIRIYKRKAENITAGPEIENTGLIKEGATAVTQEEKKSNAHLLLELDYSSE